MKRLIAHALGGLMVGALSAFVLWLILALAGCGEKVPDSPEPTPTSGPVRPGAYCAPRGHVGQAADGTAMVCTGTPQPRWRMQVRSS